MTRLVAGLVSFVDQVYVNTDQSTVGRHLDRLLVVSRSDYSVYLSDQLVIYRLG